MQIKASDILVRLRKWTLAAASFVVATVATLWIAALADEKKWFTHPSAQLVMGMNIVAEILNSPWLHWIGGGIVGLCIGIWLDSFLRKRVADGLASVVAKPTESAPRIEICFEKRAPYEVVNVQQHHVLSTARIGVKNSGGAALSNCKVHIDRISPEPPILGGWPILLEGGGFSLRHDDPEKLVDVAAHWDHMDKFRFNGPHGSFAESLHYIDDKEQRTFVLRVEALECQRSASFKIWTDETRAIHLEYIGYVS